MMIVCVCELFRLSRVMQSTLKSFVIAGLPLLLLKNFMPIAEWARLLRVHRLLCGLLPAGAFDGVCSHSPHSPLSPSPSLDIASAS